MILSIEKSSKWYLIGIRRWLMAHTVIPINVKEVFLLTSLKDVGSVGSRFVYISFRNSLLTRNSICSADWPKCKAKSGVLSTSLLLCYCWFDLKRIQKSEILRKTCHAIEFLRNIGCSTLTFSFQVDRETVCSIKFIGFCFLQLNVVNLEFTEVH